MLGAYTPEITKIIRENAYPLFRETPERFVPMIEVKIIEWANSWLKSIQLSATPYSSIQVNLALPTSATSLITRIMKETFGLTLEFRHENPLIGGSSLSQEIFPESITRNFKITQNPNTIHTHHKPVYSPKDLIPEVSTENHLENIFNLAMSNTTTDVMFSFSNKDSPRLCAHMCFIVPRAPGLVTALQFSPSIKVSHTREIMVLVLHYLYTLKFPDHITDVATVKQILAAAEEYQIKSLKEWASAKLLKLEIELNPNDHFEKYFQLALSKNSTQMIKSCLDVAETNSAKLDKLLIMATSDNWSLIIDSVDSDKHLKVSGALLRKTKQIRPSTMPTEPPKCDLNAETPV